MNNELITGLVYTNIEHKHIIKILDENPYGIWCWCLEKLKTFWRVGYKEREMPKIELVYIDKRYKFTRNNRDKFMIYLQDDELSGYNEEVVAIDTKHPWKKNDVLNEFFEEDERIHKTIKPVR